MGPDHLCSECARTPPGYHRARGCGLYDGSLKAVIQKLKYRRQVQWADPLGLILFLVARDHGLLENCDVILPVPLHGSRLKHRGFNQTYLILRKWADYGKQLNLTGALPPITPHLLQRHRPTAPQTGLAPKERQANVRDAFEVRDPENFLRGKRVVLVDDVYTTGATITACVNILKTKGAVENVEILTLARTR
jgi:ComF family protein